MKPRGTAEHCICQLAGGASQVDTFDVKEGRWLPADFDVRTVKPGIRCRLISFPDVVGADYRLALVRSMQAWENEHIRAQYYLQVAHSRAHPA